MPRRARLSTNSVVASAAVVAVATFGLGFVLSYQPEAGTVETASPTTTRAVSTTTESPRTSAAVTTPSTVASTTTLAPTTVTFAPTTVTLAPTTLAGPTTPPTQPTTTVASSPGHLVVNYPHTEEGQMFMLAGGTSALVLLNDGGEALSFRIDSAGAVLVGANGTASGALFPGETLSVPIIARREAQGPGPHATIAIFTNVGLVTTIQVTLT